MIRPVLEALSILPLASQGLHDTRENYSQDIRSTLVTTEGSMPGLQKKPASAWESLACPDLGATSGLLSLCLRPPRP